MNLPVVMQDGEQLVLLVRRHWMFLYPRLLGIIFLALVPVGAAAGTISAFAPVDPILQQGATLVGIACTLLGRVCLLHVVPIPARFMDFDQSTFDRFKATELVQSRSFKRRSSEPPGHLHLQEWDSPYVVQLWGRSL